MCLICIEVAKGSMTALEGRRALGEMRAQVGATHAAEVEHTLREVEASAAADPVAPPTKP